MTTEQQNDRPKRSRRSKLTDLEFYIPIWDNGQMRIFNLFHSSSVLKSVALYKTGAFDKYTPFYGEKDWALWCFGDTRGRVEWEFTFGDPFPRDQAELQKMDVYSVFIKPNERILRKMIDEISISSCKTWLSKERRRYHKR